MSWGRSTTGHSNRCAGCDRAIRKSHNRFHRLFVRSFIRSFLRKIVVMVGIHQVGEALYIGMMTTVDGRHTSTRRGGGGGGGNNEASEASKLLLTGQRNPERRAGVMDRLLERNTHRSRGNLEYIIVGIIIYYQKGVVEVFGFVAARTRFDARVGRTGFRTRPSRMRRCSPRQRCEEDSWGDIRIIQHGLLSST